jgi:protein SCO1/2
LLPQNQNQLVHITTTAMYFFSRKTALALVITCSALFFSCNKTEKPLPQQTRSELPEIKQSPLFSGISQQAKTVESASMQGSVWLAYFFFTSCGGPCPAMNARVEALQKEFSAPNLKFVGISVDPETDTPKALAAYAARFHADSTRWTMLQMPMDSVKSVAVQGFMLAQGKEDDPNLHSTRFVVVDKRGMIRGYFDGLDENEIPKLRKAISGLLAE